MAQQPTVVRCATVAVAATALAALLGRVLVGDLIAHRADAADGAAPALTALCEVLLLGCVTWAWAATLAVLAPLALRRPAVRVVGVPRAWRRVVLLACGVALSAGLVAPAHATPGPVQLDPTGSGAGAAVLDGLPMPRRPAVPAAVLAPSAVAAPAPVVTAVALHDESSVVVRPGDTLWAIAAAGLDPGASTAAVARRCAELHRLNIDVLGADPDLVRPGQRLVLPR